VKQIIYDSRWIGEHGIGRFAREIRKRVTGVTMDIYSSDVISASGLLNLEKEIFRISNNRKDLQFFSPGYTPPIFWRGETVFTIHDLIHLDIREENSKFKSMYYTQVVRPAIMRAKRY